jgi:hypothetical protein
MYVSANGKTNAPFSVSGALTSEEAVGISGSSMQDTRKEFSVQNFIHVDSALARCSE